MSGGIGRRARLFQTTVRQVRRRQHSGALPPARPTEEVSEEIKANEVEEMRRRIESALGAVDTA